MKKEIVLTAEELYYLGTLLRADYIDYAYVAAMDDISQRRSLYESEAREGLVGKGILTEDFSGNLETDGEAQELLWPIFFGGLESLVEMAASPETGQGGVTARRFHFYEGRVTSVVISGREIRAEAFDGEALASWVRGLLPDGYCAEGKTVPEETIDRKQVGRIVAVKSMRVAERSSVEIYLESGGIFYKEEPGNTARALTAEEFCREICRGVKGE